MKKVSFRNGLERPIPGVSEGMPSRGERRGFLRAFASGYYPSTCEDIVPHDCDPCEPSEFGRVRSAGFINQNFSFSDPTSTVEWQNAINDGNVISIPFTNGEIPMPTAKVIPGYGDTLEQLINYEFTAKFNDPNFVSNTNFYNSIAGQRTWLLFYRTSSQVYITPVTVSIIPMYTVPNDLQSKLVWEIQVKWIYNQFPVPFNIPENIFESCFELGE
jgi:hypothetical protein